MAELNIFSDQDASTVLIRSSQLTDIQRRLAATPIRVEQYDVASSGDVGARSECILSVNQGLVDALKQRYACTFCDVAQANGVTGEDKASFLHEHRHADEEIRLFAAGSATFSFHLGHRVFRITGERGDLIVLPAGQWHWFETAPVPYHAVIRFFTEKTGWIAEYSGDQLAQRFLGFDA